MPCYDYDHHNRVPFALALYSFSPTSTTPTPCYSVLHAYLHGSSHHVQLACQVIRSTHITLDEVKATVAENDKQRFSMIHQSQLVTSDNTTEAALSNEPAASALESSSSDPADYYIRANQGHSIKLESEGLLTPVLVADIPAMVVHGTTHAAWPLIVASKGLRPMTRTHIHFATGLPASFSANNVDMSSDGADLSTPAAVKSGMRDSSSVLIFINVHKALDAGIKFWRSDNDVILTEGDSTGQLGIEFFSRVEDRTGGLGDLVRDGVVLQEAPTSWSQPRAQARGTRKKEMNGKHERSGQS